MTRFAFICLIFCVVSFPGTSNGVTIGTVEEPPGNFTDDSGIITGLSVDFVREIQRRINDRTPIRVYPGGRLMYLTTVEKNLVIFSLSRTPEREDKFHWISLVMRKPLALFARKGSGLHISNLEDAKRVGQIGVLRSSVQHEFLRNHGFTNIAPANSHESNLKKLNIGRLALMYHSIQGMAEICRINQMDFNLFEPVLMPQISLSSIAMTKNSDPGIVQKWQAAARRIKADGTFKQLAEKWIRYTRETIGIPCQLKDGAVQFWED